MTKQEAQQLHAAAGALRAIEARANSSAWKQEAEHSPERATAQDYGRLAEAASIAEDVLFNVLNVASSHLHDEAAERAIKSWRGAFDA
jgi:hypothetical protein